MSENLNKSKILIVDDEPIIRELIKDQLKDLSDDIFECKDGAVALELLKKENFDVIVTDIAMPNVDGLEFIQILNELGIIIPVIVVSGFNDKEKTKTAWQRGAFDLLDKPIDFEKLRLSVEKALTHGRQFNFAKEHFIKKYYTPFTLFFEKNEYETIRKHCHKNKISMSSYVYSLVKNQLKNDGL